ncbi:MAG: deoxyguanosinetriphosphate triphosphohydrolase-like protein [Thermomicrobiales bacterium]|nr:deoxyguanosinetriphosphate triphosphohydrolase-like protein [Thermomicrobiales bacterium]
MRSTALTIRERIEAREDEVLAPAGTRSRKAQRPIPEPECGLRTAFQRDRDRVLHAKSFRRLMHKTQVFIAPTGDHYRTRLTHTLEVTQIARTIGRALGLNEDLIEAIGLGHDLGHTPFGHAGETALAEAFPGFRHNEQSLRVVDHLERDGRGLNLTNAVRDGILRHSKLRSGITHAAAGQAGTPEGDVIRIADGIAYINHDLDDAIRAGLIAMKDVPKDVLDALGPTHGSRINNLVTDVIAHSDTSAPTATIAISPPIQSAADDLREFLFARVYTPLNEDANTHRAQHIVRALYAHFHEDPERLPAEYRPCGDQEAPRRVADFVASMTDRYAIECYERIFVPHHWSV